MKRRLPWLSVLTTPRRPQYLQRTLVELDHAGAAELAAAGELFRWIGVDGDPEHVSAPPGWAKGRVGDGQGTRYAMLRTIQAAADAEAPYLLYFEDDLLACRAAVTAMAALVVPGDCGFVTGFDCRHFRDDAAAALSRHRADDPTFPQGYWGSQALKIPASSLRYLQHAQIDARDANHPNASDVWIGQQLASRGGLREWYGVLCPSLFQHVGARSAVNVDWSLTRERQAGNWSVSRDGLDAVTTIHLRGLQ